MSHYHHRHHPLTHPSTILEVIPLSSSIKEDSETHLSNTRSFDELRAKEEAYYKDYDPYVGVRIACTLGVLILLFTVFVIYKSHFHVRKARRLVASVQGQYALHDNVQAIESVH